MPHHLLGSLLPKPVKRGDKLCNCLKPIIEVAALSGPVIKRVPRLTPLTIGAIKIGHYL